MRAARRFTRLSTNPTPAHEDWPLDGLVHVPYGDLLSGASEHHSPLPAAERAHDIGARQVLHNLAEARLRNALRRRDLVGVQHGAGLAPGKLAHGANRVIRLCRESHRPFLS